MFKKIVLLSFLFATLSVLALPKRWFTSDNGKPTTLLIAPRNGVFELENPGPDTISVTLWYWDGHTWVDGYKATLTPGGSCTIRVFADDEIEIQDLNPGNGTDPRGTWNF